MTASPFLGYTGNSFFPNATWLHSAPPSNGTSTSLLSALQGLSTWPNPIGYTDGSKILLGDGSAGYVTITDTHSKSYSVPKPIVTYDNPNGWWQIATNGDGHATMINPNTQEYWDFYLLNVTNSTGVLNSTQCNRVEHGYIYAGNGCPGTTAISVAGFSGAIMPGELDAPFNIQHALMAAAPSALCVSGLGAWAPPDASGNDGTGSGVFQEGQIIFIPPSVDVSAIKGLSTSDLAVAYALQRYGALICDVDGNYLIFNTNNAVPAYSAGLGTLANYMYITSNTSSRPTTFPPSFTIPNGPVVKYAPAPKVLPYRVQGINPPLPVGTFINTDAAQIQSDCNYGSFFKTTLTGNHNLQQPINPVDGAEYFWQFTQDQTGSRTLTFDPIFTFANSDSHTLSTAAGAVDMVVGRYSVLGGKATFNPSNVSSNAPTLTATNISYNSGAGGSPQRAAGYSGAPIGRYYIEATITNNGGGSNGGVGFAGSWTPAGSSTYCGGDLGGVAFSDDGKVYFNGSTSTIYSSSNPTAGQTIGLAIDTTVMPALAWCKNVSAGTGWNNDVLANQNPAVGSQVGGAQLTGFTGAANLNVGAAINSASQSWTIKTNESNFVGTIPTGFSPLPAPVIRAEMKNNFA